MHEVWGGVQALPALQSSCGATWTAVRKAPNARTTCCDTCTTNPEGGAPRGAWRLALAQSSLGLICCSSTSYSDSLYDTDAIGISVSNNVDLVSHMCRKQCHVVLNWHLCCGGKSPSYTHALRAPWPYEHATARARVNYDAWAGAARRKAATWRLTCTWWCW